MISRLSPMRAAFFSPPARPLRFLGTGGVAGALQIVLLTLFTRAGMYPLWADIVAFLIAAQLNFALSSTITWYECRGEGSLTTRWIRFHGTIAVTALLNWLVFAGARSIVPVTAAALLGIAAGASGNYLSGQHLIFRRPRVPARPTARLTPQDVQR